MKKDTVIALKKPEHIAEDPLMEILRKGAREMLKAALEAEVDSFIARFEEVKDASGKRMVTRNGYLPERTIQTGLGDIPVKAPRVADRRTDERKVRFTSSILPPYLKRTKALKNCCPGSI
ncbi:MAG TPA: transposase [Chroococcales cyanobacterium]